MVPSKILAECRFCYKTAVHYQILSKAFSPFYLVTCFTSILFGRRFRKNAARSRSSTHRDTPVVPSQVQQTTLASPAISRRRNEAIVKLIETVFRWTLYIGHGL